MKEKYGEQNGWISILRIVLCLAVVQEHFSTNYATVAERLFAFIGSIAVPCFMFISFYFAAKDYVNPQLQKMKSRILRLYVPVIFWNFFYFVFFDTLYFIIGKKDLMLGPKRLILGCIFSHSPGLPDQLWFLVSQLVLTVIIYLLFFHITDRNDEKALLVNQNHHLSVRKRRAIVLMIFAVIAIVIQYRGISYKMLQNTAYEVKYPLGRFFECLPYAALGIIYGWVENRLSMLKRILICVAAFILSIISYIDFPIIEDFGYSGLFKLFFSIGLCLFFTLLPQGKNRITIPYINFIGSCTMGVYCLHMLIGRVLNEFWGDKLFQGSLIFDVIIFALSLFATFILRLLIKETGFKWLKYAV